MTSSAHFSEPPVDKFYHSPWLWTQRWKERMWQPIFVLWYVLTRTYMFTFFHWLLLTVASFRTHKHTCASSLKSSHGCSKNWKISQCQAKIKDKLMLGIKHPVWNALNLGKFLLCYSSLLHCDPLLLDVFHRGVCMATWLCSSHNA